MNNKAEISLTGFVVALVVISMMGSIFALFIVNGETEYGMTGSSTFQKYNQSTILIDDAQAIRNSTDFTQKTSALDIIGGYFSSGYTALKITTSSFSLFDSVITDAETDIPYLHYITGYLVALIIILIFVGVIIAVLVKMRI